MGGRKLFRLVVSALLLVTLPACQPANQPANQPASQPPSQPPSQLPTIEIHFSPRGDCTETVVKELRLPSLGCWFKPTRLLPPGLPCILNVLFKHGPVLPLEPNGKKPMELEVCAHR